jgi:hypothetical protein
MQPDSIEGAFSRLEKRVDELESGSKVYTQTAPPTYSATSVGQAVEFNEDHDGFGA